MNPTTTLPPADCGRRVLMISHQFLPAQSAGVFRTVRFLKYLPEFGWAPTVLTASPSEGEREVSNATGASPSLVLPDGTRIVRYPQATGRRSRKDGAASRSSHKKTDGRELTRLRLFARNAWSLLTETPDRDVRWTGSAIYRGRKLVSEMQADVIYTTGPPHSVHLVGAALQRLTGRAWIADLRDPWARRPWQRYGNPWGERSLARIERFCVRRADSVILNTDRAADDFRAAHADLPPGKFHVVTNGCDPEQVAYAASLSGKSRTRNSSELRILHPGSCYGRRDVRPVIDAIAEMAGRAKRVRLEQVGHCSAAPELVEYAATRGVSNLVSIEPAVPHEQILARMAAADALLLIQPDAPLMVPAKLYEMLPFRKPIIALTDDGATADLIRRFDLGDVVPSSDVTGLVRLLGDLLDHPDCHKITGKREDALRTFDGRSLTGQLSDVFDDALEGYAIARVCGRVVVRRRDRERMASLSLRSDVPRIASTCQITES